VRIFDWGKAAVLIAKTSARWAALVLLPTEKVLTTATAGGLYQGQIFDGLHPTWWPGTHRGLRTSSAEMFPHIEIVPKLAGRYIIPCWLPAHKAPAKWHGATHWPADALTELNRLLGK
jgi:hypothetical protein